MNLGYSNFIYYINSFEMKNIKLSMTILTLERHTTVFHDSNKISQLSVSVKWEMFSDNLKKLCMYL